MFHRLGARYMTITHSLNTGWADSATDAPKHGGLTPFGEEVVREMNWLGMLVDLSHVSPDTMADALRVTQAPVIFSHSVARALNDHPRNVPDDILKQMPKNGGVVMVTFVPGFISTAVMEWERRAEEAGQAWRALPDSAERRRQRDAWRATNPRPEATLGDVIAHIEHVRKVAGADYVGLGSDFDGISTTPVGLSDVSTFPVLFGELIRRGWSDADLRKLAGGNVLRVMRQAEAVAARLQKEREPSTASVGR
jgi:membrane dipeptidase